MEKFLRLNITHRPDFTYEIKYGGCIYMRGLPLNSASGEVIYWFSFENGEEIRRTWSDYEYFVDSDGDISRSVRNGVRQTPA